MAHPSYVLPTLFPAVYTCIYTDGVAIQLVCAGVAQSCPNCTSAYLLTYYILY